MERADVVVIGAGLAGLAAGVSAARHGLTCVVLEREAQPGGFARSFRRDGFTFDCSGHLLHLARDETRDLVDRTSGLENWTELSRHSLIRLEDAWIPYPFQLHLAFAPDHVREQCLAELPDEPPLFTEDPHELPFRAWVEGSLGTGIARWFMQPYNEKLSTATLDELTCEWLGRFVPRPSLDHIREGAESSSTEGGGYNATFLYPKRGGIDLLWQGLADHVPDLRTGVGATSVDTEARIVTTDAGQQIAYDRGVVLTAPLTTLGDLVGSDAAPVLDVARLRANEVTCVNLGFESIADGFPDEVQWIYLPEEKFTAYRVGIYSRFLPAMAPAGRHGAYVEIAHAPGRDEEELTRAAIADLVTLGVMASPEAVQVAWPVRLPHAYVIHDHACSPIRDAAHAWLAERDILCAGRYARWEYAAMEDALWQGLEAVDRFAERAG